jgi:alkylhydroperoxidase family enzyme
VWEAVQRDWRAAPVGEGLRATLGFVERLTLRPESLTTEHAQKVLDAGVSEDALVDAIHVAALFAMIVRLADSLAWDVPPFEAFLERAQGMLAAGYALD